jgi:hypothetical protein
MDEVIEIVRRAKRAHLGLMLNQQERVIYMRAWNHHAGLRRDGRSLTTISSLSP